MTRWEIRYVTVGPGESHYDVIRQHAADGWEPWALEPKEGANGYWWCTIYFKRPDPKQMASKS